MKKETIYDETITNLLLMQSYDVFKLIPRNLAISSRTCVDKRPSFGQIGEKG